MNSFLYWTNNATVIQLEIGMKGTPKLIPHAGILSLNDSIFTSVRASDAGPWDTFVTSVGFNQLREAYRGQ